MQRKQTGHLTQYQEYLFNVEQVIQTCGFPIRQEVLRIPSTRNIAYVGFASDLQGENNNYSEEVVYEMIRQSGPFIPRLSDREKTLQKLSKKSKK